MKKSMFALVVLAFTVAFFVQASARVFAGRKEELS
jgi:hypothetical protein